MNTTSPTLVTALAEFAAGLRDRGLDRRLRDDATQRLTDTLGVAIAANDSEPGRIARTLTLNWGGHATATPIGAPHRLPAPSAALVNGGLAHALDYDDTHVPSILHPSASVVPAALAAAESVGATVGGLRAAIVAGNEICVRLGNAGYDRELNNSVFFERGLHATSICGAIASAAAAATVLGGDSATIAHAMGIAASMGAGLLEANRVGGTVKRLHCGWAAHSGVVAAELAHAGLTGPASVFEGRFGFFQAYCGDKSDLDAVLTGLGERWEIDDLFIKPYPTNVFAQTGIDIARQLRAEGVTPEDVVSVRLGVPGPVLRTIAEPRESKIAPQSGYHAQFSGPFTFAIALTGGSGLGVYLDDFTDDAVRDPRLLELAAKVTHERSEEAEAGYPMAFPTIATVRLSDGERRMTAMVNRGSRALPLSRAELATKFQLNASRHLGKRAAGELAELLGNVSDDHPVDALMSPLLDTPAD